MSLYKPVFLSKHYILSCYVQHPRGGPRGLTSLTQQLPGPLLSALTSLLSSQAPGFCAVRSVGQYQEPVSCRLHWQTSTSSVRRCPVQQWGFSQWWKRPGFTPSAKELRLISLHSISRLQHLPSVPLCRLQHVGGRQWSLLLRRWRLWSNQQRRWGSRDIPRSKEKEEAADAAATAASISHGKLQVSLYHKGAWSILLMFTKVFKVKEFKNLRRDWLDGQIKYKVKYGIKVDSRQLTVTSKRLSFLICKSMMN